MKNRDYNNAIVKIRIGVAEIQARWKIHLIILSFVLSIISCKYFLPVVLVTGLLQYYSLHLTKLSLDSYLDGEFEESDNYEERITYFNFTVNMLILSTYIALIGKVL